LRGEHFSREKGGACLMGKAGRQLFYHGFEQLAAGLRRLLRRMARSVAADLRQPEGAS
jgi:CRISPR-associated protein Cas1